MASLGSADGTLARALPRAGSAGAWWLAARPRTLGAGIAPVAVGTALAFADGRFRALPALAALATALALQIGANLANDYFDGLHGVDTGERRGPPRALAESLLSPAQLRAGVASCFAVAALLGAYLVALGGPPLLLLGGLSIAAGLAYSGGPWPYANRGLGELAVFVFFGLVAVGGTYYVQAGAVTAGVLAAALPVGSLACAILVVNNLRDIDTDRAAGKYTLAVRLGARATRFGYAALLGIAYAAPLALALAQGAPWLLLPLVTLPRAVALHRIVRGGDPRAQNVALAGTARLELEHGLLFALGICL